MFYSEGAKTCFQLSQVHKQPKSDLTSFLCLLCCTKHAKAIRVLGHGPRKNFKITCFEIDFDGIFTYKKQSSIYIPIL